MHAERLYEFAIYFSISYLQKGRSTSSIRSGNSHFYLMLFQLGIQTYKLNVRKLKVIDWLDDEALEKLKEEREPCEAPSSHYTPKPNELGKMFWFSGK